MCCIWSKINNNLGYFNVNKKEIIGTFHCLDVDPLFEPSHVFIGGRLNLENVLEKPLDGYSRVPNNGGG